mmetsp:Transcript_13993/g.52270  ORF Transcript_13993/g.52270 Transcript_13993/m.52270 type:complete len:695 (+) Transcript_13993:2256-4340(+)
MANDQVQRNDEEEREGGGDHDGPRRQIWLCWIAAVVRVKEAAVLVAIQTRLVFFAFLRIVVEVAAVVVIVWIERLVHQRLHHHRGGEQGRQSNHAHKSRGRIPRMEAERIEVVVSLLRRGHDAIPEPALLVVDEVVDSASETQAVPQVIVVVDVLGFSGLVPLQLPVVMRVVSVRLARAAKGGPGAASQTPPRIPLLRRLRRRGRLALVGRNRRSCFPRAADQGSGAVHALGAEERQLEAGSLGVIQREAHSNNIILRGAELPQNVDVFHGAHAVLKDLAAHLGADLIQSQPFLQRLSRSQVSLVLRRVLFVQLVPAVRVVCKGEEEADHDRPHQSRRRVRVAQAAEIRTGDTIRGHDHGGEVQGHRLRGRRVANEACTRGAAAAVGARPSAADLKQFPRAAREVAVALHGGRILLWHGSWNALRERIESADDTVPECAHVQDFAVLLVSVVGNRAAQLVRIRLRPLRHSLSGNDSSAVPQGDGFTAGLFHDGDADLLHAGHDPSFREARAVVGRHHFCLGEVAQQRVRDAREAEEERIERLQLQSVAERLCANFHGRVEGTAALTQLDPCRDGLVLDGAHEGVGGHVLGHNRLRVFPLNQVDRAERLDAVHDVVNVPDVGEGVRVAELSHGAGCLREVDGALQIEQEQITIRSLRGVQSAVTEEAHDGQNEGIQVRGELRLFRLLDFSSTGAV